MSAWPFQSWTGSLFARWGVRAGGGTEPRIANKTCRRSARRGRSSRVLRIQALQQEVDIYNRDLRCRAELEVGTTVSNMAEIRVGTEDKGRHHILDLGRKV